MESIGLQIVFKSNIHQKFAIIDQSIVWYGSIKLLGYGRSEETMMRLESANIQIREVIKDTYCIIYYFALLTMQNDIDNQ